MNLDFINRLLDSGFVVLRQEEAGVLNRSLTVLASHDLRIRIVSDRGHATVDIAASEEDSEWFDLNLIKLITEDKNTSVDCMTFHKSIDFFIDNINKISTMFNKKNYQNTELKIKELEYQRARMMFPEAF